ncbi:hypothetical protein CQ14_40190 [Bradyrhizobium lablabi]|uniref:Uncharacterized protein n=1 Tax=Bradyrhizobium lablabi TaxID=722472 RepID=A0A0R3ME61_9BRAD|nr:hypothetical protein CQ14_40190 [Bradyrhizobium lablabi]
MSSESWLSEFETLIAIERARTLLALIEAPALVGQARTIIARAVGVSADRKTGRVLKGEFVPCNGAGCKNTLTFPDRLTNEAERLRQEAEARPPGPQRDELMRKARQARPPSGSMSGFPHRV